MPYSHDEIREKLKRFAESISPSIQFFTLMLSERLAKLEAQNDQAAIAVVFDQADEILLYVAESATARQQRRIADDAVLPVEQRLVRTVWSIVNAEPLARARDQ